MASFANQTVRAVYLSPNASTISTPPNAFNADVTFTVPGSGAGTIPGFARMNGTFSFVVEFNGDEITFRYQESVIWSSFEFNGVRISDAGSLPAITSASLQSQSHAGLQSSDVTFDANNIFVNWQGETVGAGGTITIDVDFDAPIVDGLNATFSPVSEGSVSSVGTLTAVDPDADASFTLVDNAEGRFTLSGNVLSATSATDFESSGGSYNVTIRTTDRTGHAYDTTFAVAVTDANEAPTLTVDQTPVSASEDVDADTAIGDVDGSDPDLDGGNDGLNNFEDLTYTIVGGNAAGLFEIDSSGQISLAAGRNLDFEAAQQHVLTVRVTDGAGLHGEQSVTINVTDVNDVTPDITSNDGGDNAIVTIDENTTAVTTVTADDADGPDLEFSLAGGADEALFAIDPSTGVLTFRAAPNFEVPVGGDNSYEVIVQASDGTFADTQTITVNVTDVNDVSPDITSNGGGHDATVSVAENATAVTTVMAEDADGPDLAFSLAGGADEGLFAIDPESGELRFLAPPNFESGDNSYEVIVRASDGTLSDTQTITVNVTDVNDVSPDITSNGGGDNATVSVVENATAVTTVMAEDADGPDLAFSLAGGADEGLFAIDPESGELRFLAPPNFEGPGDNSYEVVVRASDGTLSDEQTITVNVTNVNDVAPDVTSNGGGDNATVTIDENTTAVTTVTADDADGPDLEFSLAGGADEGLFDIDPESGELRFLAPPNHEGPGDNSYEVIVRASDGTLFDEQALTVNVTNVNDVAPAITSDGGGPTAAVAVEERITAVTTVTVTDADGPAPTFAIVGGADQARFTINATTGVLAFGTLPDFEQPGDADGDNIYDVVVRASDGTLSDDQAISVEVLDDGVSGTAVTAIGDVLWQHDDGTVATGINDLGIIGPNWQIAGTGDFDRDGDSDILWHHRDGLTTIWEMEDGAYVVNHNQGIIPTTWQIAGTGDFDADGDSDILWRNDDGQLVNWDMQDWHSVQNHDLPAVTQNWQVAGTGDFDADGDADILWRHHDGHVVLWEMQDGNFVTNHNQADAATSWQIQGTGDFDRDGDADMLWRNTSGQVLTWEMQNGGHVRSHDLGDVPTDQQVAGTWDFDHDGDSDILWRHDDGTVATWAMEAGALQGSQNFGVIANAWQVRGTGEFDLV